MPKDTARKAGLRVATRRRSRRMTQADLARAAYVSLATVKAIERGARMPSAATLEAIAEALTIDPTRLLRGNYRGTGRIHDAIPAVSAAIAAYDIPGDPPSRGLPALRNAVDQAVAWRLGAQYGRIATHIPALLNDTLRTLHTADGADRPAAAELVVSTARAADAVAFKYGYFDLSARLIDLMRWAAAFAEDPLLDAGTAYVRTETFFAAQAHTAGLRAIQQAVDQAPSPDAVPAIAACGALHMRAAVIAGRAGDATAADMHFTEARTLADQLPEGVYQGTAFGPDSVRIHEVSVAVSLGRDHTGRALDVAEEWSPPSALPAERQSGFWIELSQAQLWAGLMDDAFESLKVAREIAPQHTKEHPWARDTAGTLRRLKRADAEDLTNFADWIGAV